jgi:predicted signal transduction protein with EAL and GGDEF domain
MTEGGPIEVTASIGIAVMPAGMNATSDELLSAADEALASARGGGGNRIAYDRRHGLARLDGRRDEAVTWESDLEAG